jgi:hypothetical protein
MTQITHHPAIPAVGLFGRIEPRLVDRKVSDITPAPSCEEFERDFSDYLIRLNDSDVAEKV